MLKYILNCVFETFDLRLAVFCQVETLNYVGLVFLFLFFGCLGIVLCFFTFENHIEIVA